MKSLTDKQAILSVYLRSACAAVFDRSAVLSPVWTRICFWIGQSLNVRRFFFTAASAVAAQSYISLQMYKIRNVHISMHVSIVRGKDRSQHTESYVVICRLQSGLEPKYIYNTYIRVWRKKWLLCGARRCSLWIFDPNWNEHQTARQTNTTHRKNAIETPTCIRSSTFIWDGHWGG